ncbi:calcium-binding tyrosine phosphorylation-regulated protein isoform X1 [Globicephala melas]|uniref:calcium-binding tyrosine phosphorylation-regulated protein isoform X1 n=1 Tax=Globicephala melas TaxID=9731 RepID=UPI00122F6A01|nr:calcium-binding tyrosine phosphorylation-regulated protein isoform X1 [Globicephala melas]XP_030698493.1 calcium-binding tyrosine phosphorylation-regulated protein isoform X1 [Globicephala melas]XP_030698494.1 calcium-binding tyrosine phosphorylation-regulated protein isoform X1 [Globicephala melas]XP_030698495.1 calcium-binding tyrosine phosphorylation-regulated protein isoform X1 [Globicephala melas]XP_030698496.1 calcium-binding tyrosine phosphorylation-regulated protein isoform X1 [Globi
MISARPRLVVPYGLKTLLEGVSRAILKTNPPNITQFAAVYFKELIVFREGNNSLDVKDLVKLFHQIKGEKWSEGMAQEKKPECVKEPERTSTVSQEPKRMEKSTDTEEDNITAPQFSNKTTQFPSVHAELFSEPEGAPEAARAPSKPTAPENATPASPPSPAAVSPELAYVPADPAQFAVQMLGNVSPVHSDHSEILMVDVATSMPVFPKEMLSSEAAEDDVVATPVHSGEMAAVQVLSETSVHVDLGPKPKHHKAEPPMASSFPLQDEQEPPAYSQAPQVPLQAAIEVTSTTHIASIDKDEPVIEGATNVEQILEQTVIPFSDHVACLKGNEQSPPLSPILVVGETASHGSEKSVGSANFVQLESAKYDSSVHVEADGSATTVSSEISVHIEVDIFALAPGSAGQEDSWENRASQETEVKPALSGEAAQVVRSAIAASEAGQPPPYSNMWTLYCLTDMSQQSRPSPPPAPGPFPQATLYLPNSKEPQFLQHPPKVASPTSGMMDSKTTSAPPFILVGSNVQEAQDWKPVPQSDALKRYTAVQVPIAVPADQKFQKHTPNPQNANPPTSGQDVPRPQSPVFLSVAFPVEDVAKKRSGFGDKGTPCGSYGIAGEITVTTANVRRAET